MNASPVPVIAALAGGFNAQAENLTVSEGCSGEPSPLRGQRFNGGDGVLYFCAGNLSFLSSANFRYSSLRTATRRSHSTESLNKMD